jgi:hypothetical protein
MVKKSVVVNTGTVTDAVNCVLGVLNITGNESIGNGCLLNARATLLAAAAETLGAFTITPDATAATTNSAVFEFQIKQYLPEVGGYQVYNVSYVNPATGTCTATTVCTAIRAILNNYKAQGLLQATFAGTTTVTAVALTGYPLLSAVAGTNAAVGSVTAGVIAIGTADYILEQYPDQADNVTDGASYSYTQLIYNTAPANVAGVQESGAVVLDYWINAGLTGYSSFAASYAAAIAALMPTTT